MWPFDIFKKKKKENVIVNIPKRNKEEIELFELTKVCVSRLSQEFKPLSPTGEAEAFLFFSQIVVLLPRLTNEVIMENMEERYMFLLCDAIKPMFKTDDFYNFANNRIEFYEEQYDKVKQEKFYTPMFIYNAFYLNPGCEEPDILKDFKESPVILLELCAKLYELELYIKRE